MRKTTRKSKPQPVTPIKPKLTLDEVQRVAEKIAVSLEHDSSDMALMMLLLDHLERTQRNAPEFSCAMITIKNAMFTGTIEASEAQDRFEANAYTNRGKLLLWPYERKGDA